MKLHPKGKFIPSNRNAGTKRHKPVYMLPGASTPQPTTYPPDETRQALFVKATAKWLMDGAEEP